MKKALKIITFIFLFICSFSFIIGCGEKDKTPTTIDKLQNEHGVIIEGVEFDKDSVLITAPIDNSSSLGHEIISKIESIEYKKDGEK